ncbi:MAG: REP-associated tyrosine transposase [Acidobacteriota bacterium]
MPRRLRELADHTLYHVYARISRREGIFAQEGEPEAFLELLREVKERDGQQVLAWCLMTNHLHLLVRTGAVPLSRTMRSLQGRFAVSYNRRHDLIGPLWQSRYKAKPVTDDAYFRRLVAYIHLNPVAAGLVERPALYRWSGHAELVGRRRADVTDVSAALALFDDDPLQAQRAYLALLAALRREKRGRPEPPGWEMTEAEAARLPSSAARRVGPHGEKPKAAAGAPPLLNAASFVELAARALGVPPRALGGTGWDRATSRAREALVLIGREHFRLRLSDLAAALGKSADTLAHWVTRAASRRRSDPAFSALVERVADQVRRIRTPLTC